MDSATICTPLTNYNVKGPLHFLYSHPDAPLAFLLATAFTSLALPIGALTHYASVGVWFLALLILIVSADFLAAGLVAFKKKSFSAKVMWDGVQRKIVGYGIGLGVVHALAFFFILKGSILSEERGGSALADAFTYMAAIIDGLVYSTILFRETLSVCRHLRFFKINILPKWLVSRMEGFSESGDPSDLRKIVNESKGG